MRSPNGCHGTLSLSESAEITSLVSPLLSIKRLGMRDYLPTWQAMQDFTERRTPTTPDEIWLLQHPAVYTTGLNGKPEHLLNKDSAIPVIKTNRGGQITYHGPGQIIVYLLLDMHRLEIGVRELVQRIEQAVINLLGDYHVVAARMSGAPGVYVDGAKIAALGLRIKKGFCYHGLALNTDMDLSPFAAINPCGYPGLAVTQLKDLGISESCDSISQKLTKHLIKSIYLNSDHE